MLEQTVIQLLKMSKCQKTMTKSYHLCRPDLDNIWTRVYNLLFAFTFLHCTQYW